MGAKRKLRPADSKHIRRLLDELRDRLLSAQDGANAIWRVENAIRGIDLNERHISQEPRLYDTG
jgi:hypothetical protein